MNVVCGNLNAYIGGPYRKQWLLCCWD